MRDEHLRETNIDISAMLRALRRRWWVVATFFLGTVALVGALTATQTKQYSATAGLLFRDPGFDQKLFGTTTFSPNTDPAREAATNVRLVSLEAVAQRTARAIGRLNADQVSRKVKAEAEGQSDVVSVTATDPNPGFARVLANTFAAQYIAFRRDADRSKIAAAQRLLVERIEALPTDGRNSAQGESLRRSANQLELLASLQQGNAELVQPAEFPNDPSSPRPKRNVALAALIGLLLGIGVALTLDKLDRRIRDPEELETLLGIPLLGSIPRTSDPMSKVLRSNADGEAPAIQYGTDGEAFRMLRAQMRYFNVDRQVRTVLVTSPSAGDGKSTVALSLAAAAAGAGEKTLVIEVDLRRPTLAIKAGLPPAAGLAELLAREANLDSVVRHLRVGDSSQTLDVITAGFPAPNPGDLIESNRMVELLSELGSMYDLIVIDTPPLLVVSDAIPLMARVDGVLITSRIGVTPRAALEFLVSRLNELDAHVLGVVANGVSGRTGYYGYGPEYGAAPTATNPVASGSGASDSEQP